MSTASTHADAPCFSELLELQGNDEIEFVSIQKGQASEQLKTDQGLNFVSGQEAVANHGSSRNSSSIANRDQSVQTAASPI